MKMQFIVFCIGISSILTIVKGNVENEENNNIISSENYNQDEECGKTRPACKDAGGYCHARANEAECDGYLQLGHKYCAKHKKCGCCVPKEKPSGTNGTSTNNQAVGSTEGCPRQDGYIKITAPTEKCYFTFKERLNWWTAKKQCEVYKMKLAHPEDVIGTRSALIQKYGNYAYWLGGHMDSNGKNYVWEDNNAVIENDSPLWLQTPTRNGFPDGCLVMDKQDGDINLDKAYRGWTCTAKAYVLCEYPLE